MLLIKTMPNTDITKDDLAIFRDIIYKKIGIYFPVKKNYLLEQKLKKILIRTDYVSLTNFYKDIKDNNQLTLEILIRFMTTNHTFFFREKDHFEFLCKDIIRKGLKKPIIWCGASSTGEEVYSIIIYLLENHIEKFTLIASDIDRDVLQQMNKGLYNKSKLTNLEKYYISKYFQKTLIDGEVFYKINEKLRQYIHIKTLNLIDNNKFESKIDYIFCRNVLIYFDEVTRDLVIDNLLNNLKPGGYIFTGHSESLLKKSDTLKSVYTSVYKIKG